MSYWVIMVGQYDDEKPLAITEDGEYAKEVARDTDAWIVEVNLTKIDVGPFVLVISVPNPIGYGAQIAKQGTYSTRREAIQAAWESGMLTPVEHEELIEDGRVTRWDSSGFGWQLNARISREILMED